MSSTTILALDVSGEKVKSEELKELRNSWGSAPVVWSIIGHKYAGCSEFGYMECIEDIWKLYESESVPLHVRAMLMMTFDYAYVKKENFKRAAEDIRKFAEQFPTEENRVNHWPTIAAFYESNPDAQAIGLHQTSVTENPFDGEYDAEKEDYLGVMVADCYEIYETLEDLCSQD